MHLLKRLLCLVPLALVATGCDVSTNQTGGDWLSSQYGVRTPTAVTLKDLPLSFKLGPNDSGWLQESSVSPLYQVGQWRGSHASTMSWFAIDSASLSSRLASWDSLSLCLRLDTVPSRTRTQRLVRIFQRAADSLSTDSLNLVNRFSDRIPAFDASELYRDTLTISPKDTLRADPLPSWVRDSIVLHRHRSGVLVRLLPVDDGHDGIVQVNGTFLRAAKGSVSDTFYVGTVAAATARRGFVSTGSISPSTPTIQGGPVTWNLRLFPDTAKIRASVVAALSARGLSTNLQGTSVLDATISFDEDTSRIDSVGQSLAVYSVVNGSADTTVKLTAKVNPAQTFDSVKVSLDTVGRSGDATALLVRFTSNGGVTDSLLLTRQDTLPVSSLFRGLRTVCRRHGDTVEVVGKGVAAGFVQELQTNRAASLLPGAYIGKSQTLVVRRAFSALLNWSDRQPEIVLEPSSTDSRQWWQVRPKLGTAKLNLTLLPLGAAQ